MDSRLSGYPCFCPLRGTNSLSYPHSSAYGYLRNHGRDCVPCSDQSSTPTCIKLRIVIVAHRGLANSSKCYSCLSFDGDWPGSHELSPARRSLQSPRSISSFSASAQFISRAGCYGGPSCPNRVSC